MSKKHIGSTIAIIVGILLCLTGFSPTSGLQFRHSSIIGGIVAILGALAYRSAKKRALGQLKDTGIQKGFEITVMVVLVVFVLVQHDLLNKAYTNPLGYAIIPLWALIAYVCAFFKRKSPPEKTETMQDV